MKMKKILNIYIALLLVLCTACEDWLVQEDPRALSLDQAYSSSAGINAIVANLYSRLHFDQDFSTDEESYDLTRWDEATNNSAYWAFADNVDINYRNQYDYSLIRDINLHLQQLNEMAANISMEELAYYQGEARFLRALVYFNLVKDFGGVPIIEEVYEYTDSPGEYARARNKESEVYDYIASEVDAIVDDLNVYTSKNGVTKTRATTGAALALKCRAMLYAGSLAENASVSASKGLNLSSGATGIDAGKADEYFQKCLDAYEDLKALGHYDLYEQNPDLAANFAELFISKDNSELIFYKDYDGVNFKNDFTARAIARSQRSAANTGSQINPVLNLVDRFELVGTKELEPIDAYVGTELTESMGDASSDLSYNIYDNKEDIFAGRDPRLYGTVIIPGSTFRGNALQFQAGLAVKTPGGYEFKSAPTIEQIEDPTVGYYEGVQMTGTDGPHRTSWYVSHTGFLLRKFVDPVVGSESSGQSDVPYIVFRYGEVLLNAAEAAFQLGQTNLALELINEIRSRAGGEAFTLEAGELTMERIRNERRVELAFEDHRFYDLKRWRLADEVWSGDRNSSTAIQYALWPYKIYAPGDPDDGKWIYRRLAVEHRGSEADMGMPINFTLGMYYSSYPMNEGNTKTERNPHH